MVSSQKAIKPLTVTVTFQRCTFIKEEHADMKTAATFVLEQTINLLNITCLCLRNASAKTSPSLIGNFSHKPQNKEIV
jgi:hypothetical protein